MNLAGPWIIFLSHVVLTMVTSQHIAYCPPSCQCSSQYYVYCQSAGIVDQQLADIISTISQDAVLLDLSSNNITRIPPLTFTSLPNLEYLNLAANSITELKENVFKGLSKLRELTLNGNKIAAIHSGCLDGLTSLKELHMGDNLIESLPANVFRNLSLLDKLQLQNNRISDLLTNQFFGLSNLRLLNLSHNVLTSINGFVFSGLRSVKKLSLTDNSLSLFSVDTFNGLTNLEELMLDRNNISDIIFMYGNDFYLSINYVSLTENKIVSIPSHVFPHNANLKHIDLSSNSIRRIGGHAFNSLHLETLQLERNNISQISKDIFRNARLISSLNLGYNQLHDVQTGTFDSVRDNIIVLDLQKNQLTHIHPGMFRGMSRLRVFNLAANLISDMEPGAFKDLESLQELNLSGNLFTSLTYSMISGPVGLRKLLIVCNPLQKLSGFSYESVDDKILIESNSTMTSSTPTSALITWPYKDGTQLYWSLSIHCVNHVACEVPSYTSTIRPYVTQVTLTGLRPGAEYFVCVRPMFLSSDVNISQCVHVRTQMDSLNGVRHSTDPEVKTQDSSNSSPSFSCSLILTSHIVLLLLWFIVIY